MINGLGVNEIDQLKFGCLVLRTAPLIFILIGAKVLQESGALGFWIIIDTIGKSKCLKEYSEQGE